MNHIWDSPDSYIFCNDRLSCEARSKQERLLDTAQHLPNHIWLSTSGSSHQKWVGLSKEALLWSAIRVNRILNSSSIDIWALALPHFHVGGLAIWARSYLNQASVQQFFPVSKRWSAVAFADFVNEKKATLTSLVPTQLIDLLRFEIPPPASLRAVIIGGGSLPKAIYQAAIERGWPLLITYGMTETASQIATSPLNSWKSSKVATVDIIEGWEVCRIEGCLAFRGGGLFSQYAFCNGEKDFDFVDPKQEGWFISHDRGWVRSSYLEIESRADEIIKIGGENVDLCYLEQLLTLIAFDLKLEKDFALIPISDDRLQWVLHLAVGASAENQIDKLLQVYHSKVLPFEKIHQLHFLPYIPRSSLGKVIKNSLTELINNITIEIDT